MDTIVTNGKTAGKAKAGKRDDVRIAIVEDDPMYRHAIEYYLEKIPGNRLFSFGSGEECLKYYHLLDPEIMILDYRLNELFASEKMNGLDVLREVKSVKPETEVIFISGQENLDIATSAIKGGASEYIFKDFNALAKLQKEVAQLSLYIRMKREEMNQTKLILMLLTGIVFMLVITYLSGFHLATSLQVLLATSVAAVFGYFVIMRKRRRMKIAEPTPPAENDRPGIWHD